MNLIQVYYLGASQSNVYYYYSHDDTIKIGDTVKVPIGNRLKSAMVVAVQEIKEVMTDNE